EPVVEAADPDQESERRGDRRDDDVRVAGLLGLEDRQPGDRPQGDDQSEAEGSTEDRVGEGPPPPGAPEQGRSPSGRPAIARIILVTDPLIACTVSASTTPSGS